MDQKSHQLPSNIVAPEFGEVNVRFTRNAVEVLLTILMEPSGQQAEGWRTGVALDASVSMKWAYGQKLEGSIPAQVKAEYDRKGWLRARQSDGLAVKYVSSEALADAIHRGYLKPSENIIQALARDFIAYLAAGLDAKGVTKVVYWACDDGQGYEPVGDFSAAECADLVLKGPRRMHFGTGTCLLPVWRYFRECFAAAPRSMAIFLTDGQLEDFDAVQQETIAVARAVATGEANFMKCVLIGVGRAVSREQLEALDDLETGTSVDIWDHKIANEMRSLVEIFAEVVDEHQIVAPSATIYDDQGKVVKKFADGLPARINFQLPATATFFELEVGPQRIRQTVKA